MHSRLILIFLHWSFLLFLSNLQSSSWCLHTISTYQKIYYGSFSSPSEEDICFATFILFSANNIHRKRRRSITVNTRPWLLFSPSNQCENSTEWEKKGTVTTVLHRVVHGMDRKHTTAPESSCTSNRQETWRMKRDGVSAETNGVTGSEQRMDAQNIQVRMFFLASFLTFKMFLLMIIVSDFASLLPWFFYKQVHWKSSTALSSHNSPHARRSPTWGRTSGLVFPSSSTMKASWEGSRPRQLCYDLLSELATIEIWIFWAESVGGFCWCFAFTARA